MVSSAVWNKWPVTFALVDEGSVACLHAHGKSTWKALYRCCANRQALVAIKQQWDSIACCTWRKCCMDTKICSTECFQAGSARSLGAIEKKLQMSIVWEIQTTSNQGLLVCLQLVSAQHWCCWSTGSLWLFLTLLAWVLVRAKRVPFSFFFVGPQIHQSVSLVLFLFLAWIFKAQWCAWMVHWVLVTRQVALNGYCCWQTCGKYMNKRSYGAASFEVLTFIIYQKKIKLHGHHIPKV